MSGEEKSRLTRRAFLERSAGMATLAAASSWALNGMAEDKRPDRMAYDISRFSVTDPKLIKYQASARFHKLAARPRRITALPGDGFLLACEPGAVEFSRNGERVREFATPLAGRCAVQAEDGTVYVGTNEGIHVFGKDAQKQAFWAAPDKKTWFTGLAVNDGDVFAADSGKRVVFRFDRSGKVLNKIGEKNKDRNVPGIILPSPYLQVARGKDGLLRLNNTGRHCMELYTPDGDLELSWGKPTAAIEGFCGCCNPVGFALFPDGRYVTAEKGLPRVKVYSAEGVFESVVAGTEFFPENSRHGGARDPNDGTMGGLDVAVLSDGKILVLDLVTADVHVLKLKNA